MKKFLSLSLILLTLFTAKAQTNEQLEGSTWSKVKTVFKSEEVKEPNIDNATDLITKAIMSTVPAGQTLTDMQVIQVEEFSSQHAFSTVEFVFKKGGYFNDSVGRGVTFNVEGKDLVILWENGSEDKYEIIKFSKNSLILKNRLMPVTYYFERTK